MQPTPVPGSPRQSGLCGRGAATSHPTKPTRGPNSYERAKPTHTIRKPRAWRTSAYVIARLRPIPSLDGDAKAHGRQTISSIAKSSNHQQVVASLASSWVDWTYEVVTRLVMSTLPVLTVASLACHRYHAETVQHVCFECAAFADLRHALR